MHISNRYCYVSCLPYRSDPWVDRAGCRQDFGYDSELVSSLANDIANIRDEKVNALSKLKVPELTALSSTVGIAKGRRKKHDLVIALVRYYCLTLTTISLHVILRSNQTDVA